MKKLHDVLATTYALYLKTQSYHWNVEGARFYSLHKMFEEQYTEMQVAIDEIAELIRTKGEKVSASFENFGKISKLSKPNENLDASEMLKDLISSNQKLCSLIESSLQSIMDKVAEDLMIERLETHQKNIWFLTSISK